MLTRTTEALRVLNATPYASLDLQIQQLLAQQLIVLAIAEAEESIENEVIAHFHGFGIAAAENLAISCLGSLLRSIKTSEISGFMGRLGDDYKARFQKRLESDQSLETAFNNLVVNRHSIVHQAQCSLTLQEFKLTVHSIEFVIVSVRHGLTGK
jgi:hypothetical protein